MSKTKKKQIIKFIDLFCGIGGFHHAVDAAANDSGFSSKCVFASDIDEKCRDSYGQNFGFYPDGDITQIKATEIPDHDLLLGGFPCQAFSIIGDRKGFDDTRGTLFFDIARILSEKKPSGFVLENVKQLVGHDKGRTLDVILNTCENLGYEVQFKVLNALDFGLPQKRERIFIVGFRNNLDFNFDFDYSTHEPTTLSQILESSPGNKYFASHHIQEKRQAKVNKSQIAHGRPTIWHENKSGNISAYEFSCALRAGASYNYLLVNGQRRLTEREMLRLQGFPENHKIIGSYSDLRKQAGNALPIPMAYRVISELIQKNYIGSTFANPKFEAGVSSQTTL